MSTITPEIARGILDNPEFVEAVSKAKSKEELEKALKDAKLTPEQVAEVMKKSETLDESALENVSGGHAFDKALTYVKNNPYKVARDVIMAVGTIATLGAGVYQLGKINTSIGGLKTAPTKPDGTKETKAPGAGDADAAADKGGTSAKVKPPQVPAPVVGDA